MVASDSFEYRLSAAPSLSTTTTRATGGVRRRRERCEYWRLSGGNGQTEGPTLRPAEPDTGAVEQACYGHSGGCLRERVLHRESTDALQNRQ